MKRKHKEHLAGISVRKFVGQKKSAIIKRRLKDKTLKAAGRKRLEHIMRGMAEYYADEEIAEFRDSMRRGFRQAFGWSDKDIAEAESRVRMLNPKGKMGKKFIACLRRVQRT